MSMNRNKRNFSQCVLLRIVIGKDTRALHWSENYAQLLCLRLGKNEMKRTKDKSCKKLNLALLINVLKNK